MWKNLFICLLLLLLSNSASSAEPAVQSPQAITAAVTDFITSTMSLPGEFEIQLMPIDAQLKLPECQEPLEIFSPINVLKAGRNSIGVRCNGEKKWQIYTTALVKVYQEVLVLAEPIQRGEIVTPQHVISEKRDVSTLHDDFVSQFEKIDHKQATRQLSVGTILSLRYFSEPKLIKRGDKVVITSNREMFTIKMDGLAMMDGVKGQRIRIKNISSNRIINATVLDGGLVNVN
jgi:flagella basal body P-ring formation protein FlgA